MQTWVRLRAGLGVGAAGLRQPAAPTLCQAVVESYQAGHAYEKLASAPDVPSAADDRGRSRALSTQVRMQAAGSVSSWAPSRFARHVPQTRRKAMVGFTDTDEAQGRRERIRRAARGGGTRTHRRRQQARKVPTGKADGRAVGSTRAHPGGRGALRDRQAPVCDRENQPPALVALALGDAREHALRLRVAERE
jgi:hypothetical protein